jgi:hypothetical protein
MSLIEHIDMLWLRGNRVEAASDLITLQPNLIRSARTKLAP